jgi:plastocyanin
VTPPARALTVGLLAASLTLAACGSSVQPAQRPSELGTPAGPAVSLAADAIAFDTAELHVPANTPFTIEFENRDAVPHNVSIGATEGGGQTSTFEGAVFSGPATRWYAVPALAPGAYTFRCTVHPSMTGRLVAG